MSGTHRILSWNVNGLRAIVKKGFLEFLDRSEATFVGVQESRVALDDLPPPIKELDGWHTHVVEAERKGYSGVACFSRRPIDQAAQRIGGRYRFDAEGRVQLVTLGDLLIANVYFPNGNGKDRDNSRIPFKLAFTRRVYRILDEERKAGRPILVMGDFNTSHRDIDLARPKQNKKTSGYTPEEREELDRWLRRGKWIDTFRHFVPDEGGHYSWWSQRVGVREKNIGWRLDLVLASPGAMPFVKNAFILKDITGSDHCPVGVDVDEGIFG